MDGLDVLRDFRARLGAPSDEARARVAARLDSGAPTRLPRGSSPRTGAPAPRPPRGPNRKGRSGGGGLGRRGRLAILAGVALLLVVAAAANLTATHSGRATEAVPSSVSQTSAERLREVALLRKSGA